MEIYKEIGTPVTTLNLFEETFIKNKGDTWHKKRKNVQHISQCVTCGKKTAFSEINPKPISLKTQSIFELGNMIHKKLGKKYLQRYSNSVLEFPVEVIVLGPKGSKIKLKVTGKIDILDFGNSRIVDMKSSNPNAMRWIRTGSSKNPPGAKKSHIMQVVVYWYIWNYKIIRDPKSRYWIKECGVLYISKDELANDIYCPIPLDRYNAGEIFNGLIEEAIGIHQAVELEDWAYLDGKWQYDPDYWLCNGYCDYTEECKNHAK